MSGQTVIVAALPREIAGLVRGWQTDNRLAKQRIFLHWNDNAVVACAGMGASRVLIALNAALARGGVGEVVSVGWAGGLHSTMTAGSLHEPKTVIDARTGERFEAVRGKGVLVTSVSVAGTLDKKRLRESYAADLVDMEAATVARIAQAHGIPFRALKVVSDEHEFDMPELARFSGPDGWFREGAFAAHVALRPHLWGRAMRMARMSKQSADILCGRLRLQLWEAASGPALSGRMRAYGSKASPVDAADKFRGTQMWAAVYRGVNDVRVEKVPVPQIGAGEALVRIHTCGICGTDLKKIHTGSHSAPRVFGHEMAGTIAAIGVGVDGFSVGDRVMAFHHIPCGRCYYCRKKTFAQCETYKKVGCTAGFEAAGGGFAEYIRVMDWIVRDGLVKIPNDVPFEQAAFIEPVNTCLKGVRLLNLKADETVLVIGQGPIGIILAALAKRTGAKVLTSDLYPERHAVAAEFGLEHPLDAAKDVVAATRVASEGRGADAVILAVGVDALVRTAMDAARPGGRVMLFAATQHGETMIDPAAVCMDEKTLMGSYSASVDAQDEAAELVFDGYRKDFDLTRLISHRFPLGQAAEAIELASHPQAGSMKIVIQPGLAVQA